MCQVQDMRGFLNIGTLKRRNVLRKVPNFECWTTTLTRVTQRF